MLLSKSIIFVLLLEIMSFICTSFCKYVGCFNTNSTRSVLNGPYFRRFNMTTGICFTMCTQNGYTLFALQYGWYCYCGTNGSQYERFGKAPESECNILCAGSLKCGGSDFISVYEGDVYVGCFKHPGSNVFTFGGPVNELTLNSCSDKCSSTYRFIGLKQGNKCYCSNSLPAMKLKLNDDDCFEKGIRCEGEKTCGGLGKAAVWTNHGSLETYVPPTLSLSFNNEIIANTTYKNNHGYEEDNNEKKYVEEGKEIYIICLAEGAKPLANLTWTINGEPYDDVVFNSTRNKKENRTFDSQSTLKFIPNGVNVTVTCNSSLQGTDIQTLINATFVTYVKPKMHMKVNGIKISDVIHVEESEEVNITCHASGARPAPVVSWVQVEYRPNDTTLRSNENTNTTTDIALTLIFNASKDEEVFTCRSIIYKANITEETSLTLRSYVLPKPSLTVEGNSSDVIYIEQGEVVTVTCDGTRAKPDAKLTWLLNGHPANKTSLKIKHPPKSVFSTLNIRPSQSDTIKCTIFLPGPNKTAEDSVQFYVKGGNKEQSDDDNKLDNLWVILGLVATLIMTVLISCVGVAMKRVKASKSSNLSALQLTGNLRGRHVNGVSMTSRELPEIRQSMFISPEDNEEIYCDVEDKSEEIGNVEILVQLSGEGMFQYWTANAIVNGNVNTKIIAKCVSDSVQLKDHMKFKTLAESVATLKKHRNVVDILGVSTANVPYYIYTEYLEYGTLRDFLMRNYQQSRDSQCNVSQTLDERAIHLTGFALDVLDGLMYLTDRDYRHPALSTRKVLLNKTCTCKLYDFWPKSLSTERMHQILDKSLPPVAWLPPETIFLRHYSDQSDVWTFGIVAWEIYSLGEIPYSGLTCEEIEQEIRKMRNLDQPLTCPGGIYSMMLASWDSCADERPALSEWKQKLVCLLQTVKGSDDDDTEENGDRSYFTLENNISEYEDGYIEQ